MRASAFERLTVIEQVRAIPIAVPRPSPERSSPGTMELAHELWDALRDGFRSALRRRRKRRRRAAG